MSAMEDIYLLARDGQESERLNEQHRLGIKNISYVIHPAISARLPNNARVADVAAGSGAWTLDAAQILGPEAQVDGYDISSSQFPKQHPPNVNFTLHNAKLPFPQELRGAYDLVHVQALVAAMEPDDWKLVVRNLITLLKPGGALQWCEGDLSRMRCLRSGDSVVTFEAIPRLLAAFQKVSGHRTAFGVDELPRLFRDAGLGSVQADVVSSDRVPETREPMARAYMIAMLGWARNSMGQTDQELEQWRLDVGEELDKGAFVRADIATVIGRKL